VVVLKDSILDQATHFNTIQTSFLGLDVGTRDSSDAHVVIFVLKVKFEQNVALFFANTVDEVSIIHDEEVSVAWVDVVFLDSLVLTVDLDSLSGDTGHETFTFLGLV
jgi:hypothetical protein